MGEVERVRASSGTSFVNYRRHVLSASDSPSKQGGKPHDEHPTLNEDQLELHEDDEVQTVQGQKSENSSDPSTLSSIDISA